MKTNFDLDPFMVENGDRFQDPFFQRFELRHAPTPLQLSASVTKNYVFPTFYGDVTCAQAIFHCDYEAARSLLPDLRLQPIRMLRGRSLVALSCYVYRNVLNVAPYNEIAMAIPVIRAGGWRPPVLPMLAADRFPGFGFYVFDMPVTSLENQIRGVSIWGLPKTVREIDIDVLQDHCLTVAREESGEPFVEVRVPTGGTHTEFDVSANLYSRLDTRLLESRTSYRARFQVSKHAETLWRKGVAERQPFLRVGQGPSAANLRRLDIEPTPLELRFAESMCAAFDLPHAEYPA